MKRIASKSPVLMGTLIATIVAIIVLGFVVDGLGRTNSNSNTNCNETNKIKYALLKIDEDLFNSRNQLEIEHQIPVSIKAHEVRSNLYKFEKQLLAPTTCE